MLKRLGATARSNFASLVDPTAIPGRLLHPVDNAMNITKNSLPKLKTQGYLPTPEVLANWGDKTKILVSSSAGCLAKQNVDGELSGQGMDYSAATLLYFDGDERIEIMPTSHPKALDGKIDLTNAQVKDFRPTRLKRGPRLNLITSGSNMRFWWYCNEDFFLFSEWRRPKIRQPSRWKMQPVGCSRRCRPGYPEVLL
jgi:hypothetical protein